MHLLDEDPQPVARADVLVEVHVPGEHVGGRDRERRVLAGAGERLVHRALHVDRDEGHRPLELHLALRRAERAAPVGLDDPLVRGALPVREPPELRPAVDRLDAELIAGLRAPEREVVGERGDDRVRLREVDAEARERLAHRLVPDEPRRLHEHAQRGRLGGALRARRLPAPR